MLQSLFHPKLEIAWFAVELWCYKRGRRKQQQTPPRKGLEHLCSEPFEIGSIGHFQ